MHQSEYEKENISELENFRTDKVHFSNTEHMIENNQKSWSQVAGACFLFMKLNDQIIKKKKTFFSQVHGKRK